MVKRVKPAFMKGYNVSWNLNLFSGPKWTIKCGGCFHTFKKRIPLIDYPTVLCPACGALNELELVIGPIGPVSKRASGT